MQRILFSTSIFTKRKRKMKRNRSPYCRTMRNKLFVSFIILLLFSCLGKAGAATVGAVVNHTLHTDIATYINHYPIKSYNIDGYTSVVAEDLVHYGFDVKWVATEKALFITRGTATEITPVGTVYADTTPVGTPYLDVYESDIKTFVDGKQVPSFNVGGRTIIGIDTLSVFGDVVWQADIKSVKVWLQGLPSTDFAYLPVEEARETYPNTGIVTYTAVTGEEMIDATFEGGAISYIYRYVPSDFEKFKTYTQQRDFVLNQSTQNGITTLSFVKGTTRFAVACDPTKELIWLATADMGNFETTYYSGTLLPSYTSVVGAPCNYSIFFSAPTQAGFIEGGDGFLYEYEKASFDRYLAFLSKTGFVISDFEYNAANDEITYFCTKDSKKYRIVISKTHNQLCILPKE